jgi:oxygen-independent coproporphyrinogen-3 oxidase
MYRRTEEILSVSGYHRYEISNYSLEGRECRHNLGYWTLVPYLGFGLGASSYEEKTGDGKAYVRYRNTSDLKKYLAGDFAPRDLEYLTLRDRQAEFMILGLRLTRGVSLQEFQERFGVRLTDIYGALISKYTGQGLLEIREGRLFLTADGISVSNVVMADFMPDVD